MISDKQQLFLDYYFEQGCTNALQAYVKAYETSTQVAKPAAHMLLKNPEIKAQIKFHQATLIDDCGITKLEILERLNRIAKKNEDKAPRVSIEASKLIVSMLGLNAPIETNNTHSINVEQPLFGPLENQEQTKQFHLQNILRIEDNFPENNLLEE